MAMKREYLSVDGEIFGEVTNGVVNFYDRDALGSVVAIEDGAGNTVSTIEYKPFGDVRTYTGENPLSSPRRFLWCGTWGYRFNERYAQYTSHYVRARHYSSLQGMWSTIDPLYPSERAYGYVENRVTVGVDSSGFAASSNLPTKRIGPPGLQWDELDIQGLLGGERGNRSKWRPAGWTDMACNEYWSKEVRKFCHKCSSIMNPRLKRSCYRICRDLKSSYSRKCGFDSKKFSNQPVLPAARYRTDLRPCEEPMTTPCHRMAAGWNSRFTRRGKPHFNWVIECRNCCEYVLTPESNIGQSLMNLVPFSYEILKNCATACQEGEFGSDGLSLESIAGILRGL